MTTLTADDCATLLNCSKSQVHRLVRRGEIPGVKVGRGWVFIEADIVEWLREKSKHKPVAPPRQAGRPRKRVVL